MKSQPKTKCGDIVLKYCNNMFIEVKYLLQLKYFTTFLRKIKNLRLSYNIY